MRGKVRDLARNAMAFEVLRGRHEPLT
jgi:hypothetical protein